MGPGIRTGRSSEAAQQATWAPGHPARPWISESTRYDFRGGLNLEREPSLRCNSLEREPSLRCNSVPFLCKMQDEHVCSFSIPISEPPKRQTEENKDREEMACQERSILGLPVRRLTLRLVQWVGAELLEPSAFMTRPDLFGPRTAGQNAAMLRCAAKRGINHHTSTETKEASNPPPWRRGAALCMRRRIKTQGGGGAERGDGRAEVGVLFAA